MAGINGMPGSGKSTLISRYVYETGVRALLYDPTRDMGRYLLERYGMDPRHVRICTTREDTQAAVNPSRLHRTFYNPARVVIVSPPEGRGTSDYYADVWLELAASPMCDGWTLACDESEKVFPNQGNGLDGDRSTVITIARNRGTVVLVATKRPQLLSTSVRDNSLHVCVFRSDSAKYLNPGMECYGRVELFDEVPRLEKFQYLYRPPWRKTAETPLDLYHALKSPLPF